MTGTLTRVPPIITIEYKKLREDSKFKSHKLGLNLFLSLFTGYYEGQKISIAEIASKLDVSHTVAYKTKNRVKGNIEVDWSQYDLKALKAHYDALKDVAGSIPEKEYRLVPGDDGVETLVPVETNPTKWIATQHKAIMKDGLELMVQVKDIAKDLPTYLDNNGRERIQMGAHNTFANLMNAVRPYTRDWLELFGNLEESLITDAILTRRSMAELCGEFLLLYAPELASKWIEYLAGSHDTSLIEPLK